VANEQALAVEVIKRLGQLRDQPLHYVPQGAVDVMAMLAPKGVINRAAMALPDSRSEVLAEVMSLALVCERRASEDRIRQALDSALLAAGRWHVELQRMSQGKCSKCDGDKVELRPDWQSGPPDKKATQYGDGSCGRDFACSIGQKETPPSKGAITAHVAQGRPRWREVLAALAASLPRSGTITLIDAGHLNLFNVFVALGAGDTFNLGSGFTLDLSRNTRGSR
jgi:hypothetical protein